MMIALAHFTDLVRENGSLMPQPIQHAPSGNSHQSLDKKPAKRACSGPAWQLCRACVVTLLLPFGWAVQKHGSGVVFTRRSPVVAHPATRIHLRQIWIQGRCGSTTVSHGQFDKRHLLGKCW